MENNGPDFSVDSVLESYFNHVSTILFSFQSRTMYANDFRPVNDSVGSSISIDISL